MRRVANSVNSPLSALARPPHSRKLIQISARQREWGHHAGMADRAETLRQQIAFYRRQLEAGVASELAAEYLAQILKGEAELRTIAEKERVNEQLGGGGVLPQPGDALPDAGRSGQ